MIFLDYHGYIISQIHGYSNFIKTAKFDDKFFIERFLVNLGKLSKRYSKYGTLVIAADSSKRKYWRTKEFEYYKAGRYQKDDDSKLSVKDLETREKLKRLPYEIEPIIRKAFPFYFIKSEEAEADDVIATLISYFFNEKHVILSSDKDFIQLQKYDVDQYDLTRSRWLKSKTPDLDLQEKIFRGDGGDGIPNVLSDSDTLVNQAKKQKRMTQKQLSYLFNLNWEKLAKDEKEKDSQLVQRYLENKKLIDLSETPLHVREDIMKQYFDYGELKNGVMNYCLKSKSGFIFENISLFN